MFPERTDQALISLENRPAPLESHDRGRTSIGKVDIFRPEADIFVRKLLIPGKTLFYASVTLREIAPPHSVWTSREGAEREPATLHF